MTLKNILILGGSLTCLGLTQNSLSVSSVTHKNDCETVSTKKYIWADSNFFCSSSLFLNSDSTFSLEGGCEGHSQLTIGTWTRTGDKVELKGENIKKVKMICQIKSSATKNSLQVVFFLYDKTGQPVDRFYLSDARGKHNRHYVTDNTGRLVVQREEVQKISFSGLDKKTYNFKLKELSDTVNIRLNLNINALSFNDVRYQKQDFTLRVSGDKLIGGGGVLTLVK